jgi:cation diffusion facilitator CzcD-associated flavoprotein CzcO
VGRLHLFQRTAPWIMPRPDRPLKVWERRLYRALPTAQLLMRAGIYWARESFVLGFRHPRVMRWGQRLALRHLHRQVHDPELRRELTPSYRMGCKRVLISNDYLPALTRENVEVVTDAIREVRERSIVSADGTEREVDTIIFATGFHVTDMPAAERVRARDGRSLADVWDGSPQAHMGAMVAGCPNLFFLVGPNTGLGHNSAPHGGGWRRRARGQARGPGSIQRTHPGADARDGVDVGRLRELVPRRPGAQHDAVADLHVAVPPAHAQTRPRALRAARAAPGARERRRLTRIDVSPLLH